MFKGTLRSGRRVCVSTHVFLLFFFSYFLTTASLEVFHPCACVSHPWGPNPALARWGRRPGHRQCWQLKESRPLWKKTHFPGALGLFFSLHERMGEWCQGTSDPALQALWSSQGVQPKLHNVPQMLSLPNSAFEVICLQYLWLPSPHLPLNQS